MIARSRIVVATLLLTALAVACTSPTSPAVNHDCGGGSASGSGTC